MLDAGPVVSLLLDDPAAARIADELAGRERMRISVVNIAEVVDVLRRVHRVSEEDVGEAIDRVLAELADPVDATRTLALRAADIRARHYHRRDRDLSLADAFVVATAAAHDAVATSDAVVARAARAEGIEVLPLPNARGRRPSL